MGVPGEDKLEVWRFEGMVRADLGGVEVSVGVYTRKVLGRVIGRRQHDNGYEKNMTDLRQDWQGRVYHQHIEIDYYSPPSWWRDGDKKVFHSRPFPVSDTPVDVLGRPLDMYGKIKSKKPLDISRG